MAGGNFIAADEGGSEYPGKLTRYVAITCIMAAMGGQLLTLFTSSLYVAAFFASFVASSVSKKRGREVTMFLGGLLFLFGAVLNAAAVHISMLILGRILLGIGVGFANQSVPIYLSEIAPYKYRGTFNVLFQLAITFGILIANFLTNKISAGWGWRVSLGGAAVPALVILISSLFLDDTPSSLIQRGKTEEAEQLLKKIRGVYNVNAELKDLVEASEASKKVQHPWKVLFRVRKYKPQLILSTLIPTFQQLTGINVVMFYAPVLFETLGFKANASLMSAVITGAVNFYFSLLYRQGWLPQSYAILVVLCICVFVAAFAFSWGPLGWLIPSEISPLEVRSAAQSVTVSMNMLFTFGVAQVFLKVLCWMKFGLFIFFAAFVFIMTLFVYFYVPETKNIPIEEMSRVLREHWYWKNYMDEQSPAKEVVF
ncbi:hypothetical protein KY290_020138 [Solanum tuberosum]|uniref:Major facilitator superfamily (MFS) profile domain-containing protein n=1 Tax=Solanum tuberosum TaxID=4113 RepID=A0ABQ7VM59_SOLTU|nr:hypothetical protein KY290_020138 [Solanum tuberosum]